LFPGKSIDDYTFKEVHFSGGALKKIVTNFGFERSDKGMLSVEAQAKNDSLIKGARITFFDGDDGIYGSIDYTGWFYGSDLYSVSIEEAAAKNNSFLPVVRDPTSFSGYGVNKVVLTPKNHVGEVSFKDTVCNLSSVSIGPKILLTVDNTPSALNAGYKLSENSELTVRNIETVELNGSFSAVNAEVSFNIDLPADPRPLETVEIE
jgi:hypothetical protein